MTGVLLYDGRDGDNDHGAQWREMGVVVRDKFHVWQRMQKQTSISKS